ncbi:MAG: glutathione S-transferase family protein [Acidihalobacter sp.]
MRYESDTIHELFYYPGHASLAPHIALIEVEAVYTLNYIDIKCGAQFAPAYLEINPLNTIPAMRTGDGIITESAAICTWLALEHDKLLGKDAVQLQWMFYLSNTVQPTLMDYHYPELRLGAPCEVRERAKMQLQEQLTYISHILGKRITLGLEFGISDIYLFMLTYWTREFLCELVDVTQLRRAHAEARQRASVVRALELENLSGYMPAEI